MIHLFQNDYSIGGLLFKNYINLTELDKIEVLNCRNDESVRKWMTSTEPISKQDHLAFIDRLKETTSKFYWAIYAERGFLGSVSLVDMHEGRATPGIFLNPQYIGKGIGVTLTILSIDFFFETLNLESIHSLVQRDNAAALRLNKMMGYTFVDDGSSFITIEMSKQVWEKNRIKLLRTIRHI